MVAPVIMKFGSDAQKKRHLPKIAAAEERGARATPSRVRAPISLACAPGPSAQGDHYIVNGQKIWTTTPITADWIFCLVRTANEGKRQEGISFLLIDMKSPGIEVEPIITCSTARASTQEVNQVFFTDVQVPAVNRIGEENKGWTYAKYLLEFERGGKAARSAPALGLPNG